jgi:translation initiation factor IF-3
LKEIKLSPNIGSNDVDYRIKQAIKFLEKGEQVKLSIRIIGKARRLPETEIRGRKVINDFVERSGGKANGPIQSQKMYGLTSGLAQVINPKKGTAGLGI